jgi:hypothetical protein
MPTRPSSTRCIVCDSAPRSGVLAREQRVAAVGTSLDSSIEPLGAPDETYRSPGSPKMVPEVTETVPTTSANAGPTPSDLQPES